MKKIELLAPAGDLEKLKMAVNYGADAVYLGGESFGLRKASKNFNINEIKEGIEYCHERGKKVYITLNIVPHDNDMIGLEDYVIKLREIGADAVIVSDPGVFSVVNRVVKDLPIHISTQASVTNYETIMFWYSLGVRRIVLARELSLEEIKNIKQRLPEDLELEAFIHGAMCISYSGRCLLSNYMTGRDSNQGDCSHACRYKYNLVEEKRPGEYFPVYEDDGGTFIMNSKDLCMIPYIPELIESGISSFKIEGRVKSAYYVSTIIHAYRNAIDELNADPKNYKYDPKWLEEIEKASHREFTTGFYFGKTDEKSQLYTNTAYIRGYDFVGLIKDYDKETKLATVEQRNRMYQGDRIEIFGPNREYFAQDIKAMFDGKGNPIEVAPHAQQTIKILMEKEVKPMDIIRKELDK